jgi:hypothetical protein
LSGELLGREHHLGVLREALAVTRAGAAVTVLLHGAAGLGKTALVDALLAEARLPVLASRCHPLGGGPHRVLAPLVADLARLAPPGDPDLALLVPLFPALAAAPEGKACPDPHELRRRAGVALRALLVRHAPLVVVLDDLDHGDADSLSLLLDVLAHPAPPVLLLAAYRREQAFEADLGAALIARMARGEEVGDVRELVVGPLASAEARALARTHLGEREDDAPRVARESGGNPFFVRALCRLAREGALVTAGEAIARAAADLPPGARRLLDVLAVAGAPLPLALAAEIAGAAAPAADLAALLARGLARGGAEAAEPAHAHVRAAVLAELAAPARAALHLALGLALRGDPGAADLAAEHLAAGGAVAQASAAASEAASFAASALAFRRAAALEDRARAFEPSPAGSARHAALLALAGRGVEAARAYLAACDGGSPIEAAELRRRAAEQLFRRGLVGEALAAADAALSGVDLALPRSAARAYASLLYRRARVSLRGLDVEPRAAPASPEELARVDMCWSVGNALRAIDVLHGAEFQARHLLYALDSGDPQRASRALSSEAIDVAMQGGRKNHARAALLVARARDLADLCGHPHAQAWSLCAAAALRFHEAHFADALDLADGAVALLRASCAEITWEVGLVACWWQSPALFHLGRLADLAGRLPAALKEAEDRGALSTLTTLRAIAVPRVLLLQDRPTEARREAESALAAWPDQGWREQRWCALLARVHTALYEGWGQSAHAEMEAAWPALTSSRLLGVESVRVESLYVRALAALAASPPDGDGDPALSVASAVARSLGRAEAPPARPCARAIQAGLALAKGQPSRAAQLLEEAERGFLELGMALLAAAVRLRRGELLRGDEGRALWESAEAWMRDRGVERPDRVAAMLVALPGG